MPGGNVWHLLFDMNLCSSGKQTELLKVWEHKFCWEMNAVKFLWNKPHIFEVHRSYLMSFIDYRRSSINSRQPWQQTRTYNLPVDKNMYLYPYMQFVNLWIFWIYYPLLDCLKKRQNQHLDSRVLSRIFSAAKTHPIQLSFDAGIKTSWWFRVLRCVHSGHFLFYVVHVVCAVISRGRCM